MPTYEYVCDACQHRFERFQRISDPPVKTCPECGEDKARRLISSGAGLVFKGPGFYATDYRKGPAPKEEGGKGERGEKGEKEEKGEKGQAGKSGEGAGAAGTGAPGEGAAGSEPPGRDPSGSAGEKGG